MNQKYELEMQVNESFIEFKLSPKNSASIYHYQERLDLKTINKLFFSFFDDLKEVFIFYDKVLNKQKINLKSRK